VSEDGKVILAVNGEIYNHLTLRASVGSDVKFKTHSDCEVIIPLASGFSKCLNAAKRFPLVQETREGAV
jgi:asparagine synthase (glutamine-hydrolysing)